LILLQREVRRHFSCPSLEGGELEDQGVNGTASTHWEKRVYEVNFALLYKYSLTLSLFKDALSFPINLFPTKIILRNEQTNIIINVS